MKKLSILFLAILLMASMAFAKQAQSATAKIVSQLNLPDDQKAKVDPIVDADAKQLRAIKADTTLTDDARKAKNSEVRKDTETKLKAVLTDEQWKKYQELKAAHKSAGKKT
jgi:protein CpxP